MQQMVIPSGQFVTIPKRGLERVKELVSNMNDFEFKQNTSANYLAYQELRRQLTSEFNYLLLSDEEEWKEANRYIEDNLKMLGAEGKIY